MERETREVTLPSGKTAVLNAHITGMERRALRQVLNIAKENKEDDTDSIIEDALIKAIVVSYDSSNEKIIDRLLEENCSEIAALLEECHKALPESKSDPKAQVPR